MSVKTLARGLRVLFFVCESERPLGLTEISRRIGIDKATTYRVLKTLVAENLLKQSEDRAYGRGPALDRLSGRKATGLKSIASPHLSKLRDLTRETVCLIVRQGHRRVCIQSFEPDRELRVVAPVGSAQPIHAGASGRVLLAFAGAGDREGIVKAMSARGFKDGRIRDAAALQTRIRRVQKDGFAVAVDELTPGTSALAVPVIDGTDTAVAAVVVRGPTQRMAPGVSAKWLVYARQAAAEIGNDLRIRQGRLQTA